MKKIFLKSAFVLALFLLESFIQILMISLLISIDKDDGAISLSSFLQAFSGTFDILFYLKLVFFLPVYFLYYLFIKDDRIASWMDIGHLVINLICLCIAGILLSPWAFSPYGIFISIICLIIALLVTVAFKSFWNKLITRYPFRNSLQGTLNH